MLVYSAALLPPCARITTGWLPKGSYKPGFREDGIRMWVVAAPKIISTPISSVRFDDRIPAFSMTSSGEPVVMSEEVEDWHGRRNKAPKNRPNFEREILGVIGSLGEQSSCVLSPSRVAGKRTVNSAH
jgi:hypothetical protein